LCLSPASPLFIIRNTVMAGKLNNIAGIITSKK
jgi:hypothetical protein